MTVLVHANEIILGIIMTIEGIIAVLLYVLRFLQINKTVKTAEEKLLIGGS